MSAAHLVYPVFPYLTVWYLVSRSFDVLFSNGLRVAKSLVSKGQVGQWSYHPSLIYFNAFHYTKMPIRYLPCYLKYSCTVYHSTLITKCNPGSLGAGCSSFCCLLHFKFEDVFKIKWVDSVLGLQTTSCWIHPYFTMCDVMSVLHSTSLLWSALFVSEILKKQIWKWERCCLLCGIEGKCPVWVYVKKN